MASQADEITTKLVALQRSRVAEAEARLDEERRKLAWMESLTGDLARVLEEVGPTNVKALAKPEGLPEPPQAPKSSKGPSAKSRKAPASAATRALGEQEILDYVDQIDGAFTPTSLMALAERQCGCSVELRRLQASLRRMASVKKGIRQVSRGKRGMETVYGKLSLSE